MERTPKYLTKMSWSAMKQRCTNPKDCRYNRYGGRGIKVCERWMNSYQAFEDDMGFRPEGMTLDREDTDGDYEPGNCKWATPLEQNNNSTQAKSIEINGVTYTSIAAACRAYSVSKKTVESRVLMGMTFVEAISHPGRVHRKKL